MTKRCLQFLIYSSIAGFSYCGEIGASDIDPRHLENKPAPDSDNNLNNIPSNLQAKIMNHVAESEDAGKPQWDKRPLKHIAKQSVVSKNINVAMKEALNTHELFINANDLTDDNVQKIKHIGGLYLRVTSHIDEAGIHPLTDDIMKRIGELTNLKELVLHDARITGEQLRFVSNLKNLTYIDLVDQPLANEDLKHLSSLEKLEYIRISSPKITSAGLAYLIKSKGIKELDLMDCNISHDEMAFISLNFPNLEIINLRGTPISDADLKFLSNLSFLKRISLDETNITDKSLEYFKLLPKNIIVSGMDTTKVTPEGLRKLKEHFNNIS